MGRVYSSIWNEWIKKDYYGNETIFGQNITNIPSEAHHINERGRDNDDNPLNIVVISKLLHTLYTFKSYELAAMYINELIENPIGNTKQDIDTFFKQKAEEQFNSFIANKNNINNLPQGEYTVEIIGGKQFEDNIVFYGVIKSNGYQGVKTESLIKRNTAIYKLLCKERGKWYPQDFFHYWFKAELFDSENNKYFNLKEIVEGD